MPKSGAAVGSGNPNRARAPRSPQRVDVEKVESTATYADRRLRELEESIIKLKKTEAERDGLYEQSDEGLAQRFGLQDGAER